MSLMELTFRLALVGIERFEMLYAIRYTDHAHSERNPGSVVINAPDDETADKMARDYMNDSHFKGRRIINIDLINQ